MKDTEDGGRDIVSDLDLIVEEQLVSSVRAIEPGASIFSEESTHDPSALDDDVCFVIDPIDGTELMLAGDSGYAISIAVLSHRRVVAGLLDFPARRQRFTCALGNGARLNGEPIHLHGAETPASARIAVSSTQLAQPLLEQLWPRLNAVALVPTPGFTAKIASVLTGECDAALYLPIEPRATYLWDYAAAAILLEEAGARLTTLDGHAFLHTLPIQQSEGWLAASISLLASLQEVVADGLRVLRAPE